MKISITLITTLIIIQGAFAQYDPEALTVLDAMSNKYKNVNAFNASFTQKLTNKQADVDEAFGGKITVKGSKYILDLGNVQIFNDGTNVYTYDKEFAEVSISTFNEEDFEINPGNVYDLYKSGFKYALISKMSNGDRVIELDPESRDKSYFKIRMVINSNDYLKSFQVYERTNNIYTYSIDEFEETVLEDDKFTFDPTKYPGVEVIDLR